MHFVIYLHLDTVGRINLDYNFGEFIFFIAVVLDTNKWFHQTDIVGKELSITIGSEYD